MEYTTDPHGGYISTCGRIRIVRLIRYWGTETTVRWRGFVDGFRLPIGCRDLSDTQQVCERRLVESLCRAIHEATGNVDFMIDELVPVAEAPRWNEQFHEAHDRLDAAWNALDEAVENSEETYREWRSRYYYGVG